MEMIALIMSGLALLAACVCLCLLVQEKKRNQKRNAAMLDYINRECEALSTAAGSYTDESCNRIAEKYQKLLIEIQDRLLKELYSEDKKILARVEKLEQGVVPDFEAAMAAANAVNSFNQGISNILGFDPHEALEAKREKERQGE